MAELKRLGRIEATTRARPAPPTWVVLHGFTAVTALKLLEAPEAKPAEVQIPASLAAFAEKEGLTFKQAIALLRMRQQIVAHRSSTKRAGPEKVDWQKFYEAVKEFLE